MKHNNRSSTSNEQETCKHKYNDNNKKTTTTTTNNKNNDNINNNNNNNINMEPYSIHDNAHTNHQIQQLILKQEHKSSTSNHKDNYTRK